MALPKLDFSGEEATITMMQLRAQPGEVMDRVARGLTVHVEKHGKRIATISPPETVIHSDGTFTGRKPLTFRQRLGGEYAS